MPERPPNPELEESTNRWMVWGAVIMAIMVMLFPLYRLTEPSARAEARQAQLASLAEQGESIYSFNCASCHGLAGEGGLGPTLNAEQFFASATDGQIELLTAVGVPGSPMGAYSQDFAGPLTSEQIRAVTTFLRTWEDNAPDVPDWREFPK